MNSKQSLIFRAAQAGLYGKTFSFSQGSITDALFVFIIIKSHIILMKLANYMTSNSNKQAMVLLLSYNYTEFSKLYDFFTKETEAFSLIVI